MKDKEKSREQLVQELVKMRKHTAKLQKEQSLLMNMMDNIPDALYFKDRKSRFVLANKSCARKHGFEDPREQMGKTDFDFFAKEHAQQAYEDEQEIIRTGKALTNIDEKETWRDGTVTWVSTTKMPLKDKDCKIIGTFGISRDITDRKLVEEELRIKKEEMEKDLDMAREVQMALLSQNYPKSFPLNVPEEQGALHFSHRYIPTASLAGDFFEILPISDHQVGIMIYDVMGHGVRASLLTAYLHGLVEELMPIAADPVTFLKRLNLGLTAIMEQFLRGMFATAFYLVADIKKGKMYYTNAGHPKPYILKRNIGAVEKLEHDKKIIEPALGLFHKFNYTVSEYPMNNDDIILFFTDGIYEIENANGQMFGEKKLMTTVSNKLNTLHEQMLDAILNEINNFAGTTDFNDDVCIVSMHVKSASV